MKLLYDRFIQGRDKARCGLGEAGFESSKPSRRTKSGVVSILVLFFPVDMQGICGAGIRGPPFRRGLAFRDLPTTPSLISRWTLYLTLTSFIIHTGIILLLIDWSVVFAKFPVTFFFHRGELSVDQSTTGGRQGIINQSQDNRSQPNLEYRRRQVFIKSSRGAHLISLSNSYLCSHSRLVESGDKSEAGHHQRRKRRSELR